MSAGKGSFFPSPEGFEKLKEILGSEIENLYLNKEIELPKRLVKAYFYPLKKKTVEATLEKGMLYLQIEGKRLPVPIGDVRATLIEKLFGNRINAVVYELRKDKEQKILIPISLGLIE